jgi:kynurenine formamidase
MAIIDTDRMRIFDLEFPRTANMPEFPTHKPAYAYTLYHRHDDRLGSGGVRSSAFGQLHGTEHAGTHIDALSHQAECMSFHGGVAVTPEIQTSTGFAALGAEHLPPIFADGVLLDVAALKDVKSLEPRYTVTANDLSDCCKRQNITIDKRSVVLVNLGNCHYWSDESRYLTAPGMDRSATEWLIQKEVLAVGADNNRILGQSVKLQSSWPFVAARTIRHIHHGKPELERVGSVSSFAILVRGSSTEAGGGDGFTHSPACPRLAIARREISYGELGGVRS